MMERRKFLRALVCLPAAPVLLRGMSWAAPTQEEVLERRQTGRKSPYTAEVPPGTILPYVGESCPPGFLPCDGRSVPRFMFPKLHSAIGGAYGPTSSLTFRLPDLRVSSRPAAALKLDDMGGFAPPPWRYVIRT